MSAVDRAPRAAIVGCAGLVLTEPEAEAFAAHDPLGFILFKRNVADPVQLRGLTAALRRAVGRDDAPILIDQEGGRVARLGPPHWWHPPAASSIAGAGAEPLAWNCGRLIAADLHAAGISIDCAPCLDLAVAGASPVIGDRAFAADPASVARLGRAFADGLRAGGVLPVIKHLPGHGRALVDSHAVLPRVDATLADLDATDLAPFRALRDLPVGMTGHIVFAAVDPDRPATLSRRVIADVIRDRIGFTGLLLSDDIGMGALEGSIAERAGAAILAGCDVVLECSGVTANAVAACAAAGALSAAGRARLARAGRAIGVPDASDLVHLRYRVDAALPGLVA